MVGSGVGSLVGAGVGSLVGSAVGFGSGAGSTSKITAEGAEVRPTELLATTEIR